MQNLANISFEQLIQVIRHLPARQKAMVKSELEDSLNLNQIQTSKEFREFLLNGPVMTDSEFDFYLENRKKMNQWRS